MKKIILVLSILTVLFAISCSNEDKTGPSPDNPAVKPPVLVDTEEAKAFLALLEGKTKVVDDIMTIEDGGKTLNFAGYKYSFQSAKSSTIAYYTEEINPKDMHTSFPDKTYYSYRAFEVKDGKLIGYYETTAAYEERGAKFFFDNFEFNEEGDLDFTKPKKDVNKIDFSVLAVRKDDIDFELPFTIGTLQ